MKTYDNVVEAIDDLANRGFTANLSLEGDAITDKSKNIKMTADDFEIDEFYRFEGESNPDDMSIVFAITSKKYDLKGVLVNAFGTYANNASSTVHARLHYYQILAEGS